MDPRESQTVKVRGVPFSATSQDLGRFFQGCGEVLVRSRVLKRKKCLVRWTETLPVVGCRA
jgi:RNA recognition motif-containing protein